ncbi:MAG TPA: SpoIIE family protein phosphatase [Trebonia sp.]|jgi:serine phosphatase RsbU (regulator of sigma subunit)/DNA-binding response OmpR family regulator|nr:SpoIIE family protein phosphatase [Trebonia sp.]
MTESANLLLVDDDEAKRYILATWLRRAGYAVTEVATGQEALSGLGGADLVVLDVNLPDMSGFEVCRRIKADPRTAAIPVIQVSATAVNVADRAHGLTQGADAYLIEPTEPEELLATVMAALRYYRARHRAERSAAMLAALADVSLHINAAETYDGLAAAAATGAARIFSVPAILILEMPDGQVRRVSAMPGRPETIRRGGPPGLAARVAESVLHPGEASAIGKLSRDDWVRVVPDSTLRSDVCLAVARTKPGKTPAAIVIDYEGISGDEELPILRQLTQLVALGFEALRSSAEEHLVALTLQGSFLPAALPVIPGVLMASRYLPASDRAEVGGDFYEAMPRGNGVLVAIGDVQGHSLHAAIVMGELRHALRAFASEGHSPLAITGLINEVLRRYHPNIIATLCLVVLDPETGELSIVNCGHMPVLLVDDGGGGDGGGDGGGYVGEGGLMLGLTWHQPHEETARLPVGGTALLYTDGLVEDRHVLIDHNLDKLRTAALQHADADVEAFANHVMSAFGSGEDDVAMIVVRRTG